MTAAFQAAVSELGGSVTEDVARKMAQSILSCTAEGVFNADTLKEAALKAADGKELP